MRILPTSLVVVAFAGLTAAQNPDVRTGTTVSDPRARNVGDILTVVVQEQQSVKNEDNVERHNDTSLAARLKAFSLSDRTSQSNTLPRIDLRKEQGSNGEAKQNSSADVRASLTVIVVDVQPNGNLVVAGARSVTVNDEQRTLRVSGVVRPLDINITSSNSVGSDQVADARISIQSAGANTRQVTRGSVAQCFDTMIWAAWPF